MKTPQILWITLMAISLLLCAHDHGKEKTGKENFFVDLTAFLIHFSLLLWGGFFN